MTGPLSMGVVGVVEPHGHDHVRHLASMSGVRLAGVYDIDLARAAEIAAAFECRVFASLPELLDRVHAVSVAVPTPNHLEVGLECLAHGVAVLMEKPFATSLEEADDLLAAAQRNGVLLAVGHVERFNRAVRAARAVLDKPVFLEGTRLAPFPALRDRMSPSCST